MRMRNVVRLSIANLYSYKIDIPHRILIESWREDEFKLVNLILVLHSSCKPHAKRS